MADDTSRVSPCTSASIRPMGVLFVKELEDSTRRSFRDTRNTRRDPSRVSSRSSSVTRIFFVCTIFILRSVGFAPVFHYLVSLRPSSIKRTSRRKIEKTSTQSDFICENNIAKFFCSLKLRNWHECVSIVLFCSELSSRANWAPSILAR